MKKAMFIIGSCVMMFACSQKQNYTMQSPEIDTVKALIDLYNKGEAEGQRQYYADSAKIFHNSLESNPITVDEMISQQKMELGSFTGSTLEIDEDAIEMVTTDEGETWVNVWGTWKGTMTVTGKAFETPVHSTFRFVEGKIVTEHGYWDNSPYVIAFMEYEAAQKAAADTLP